MALLERDYGLSECNTKNYQRQVAIGYEMQTVDTLAYTGDIAFSSS